MRVRTLVTLVLALTLAVGAAGVAVLETVDFNRYRGLVAERITAATGRTMTIRGNLEIAFVPSPTLVVHDVALANVPWGTRPDMVTARRFTMELALAPLLRGILTVRRMALVEPDILFETNREGRNNWTFDGPAGGFAQETVEGGAFSPSGMTAFDNAALEIRQAVVTLRDGAKGDVRTFRFGRLTATTVEDTETPTVFSIEGTLGTVPVAGRGKTGSLADVRANRPFALDLTVMAAGATVTVSGVVARPVTGEGLELSLDARGADFAALGALWPAVALPVSGPYQFGGRLTGGGKKYTLAGLTGTVGESDVAGTVTITESGQAVAATLSSRRIDLSGMRVSASPVAPVGSSASDPRVIPDWPLSLAPLQGAAVELKMKAETIRLARMVLTDVTATLATTRHGALAIELLTFGVAGGRLTLIGHVEPIREGGILVRLRADGEKIGLGQVLTETALLTTLEGAPAKLKASLVGRGTHMRALAADVSGQLTLSTGPARLRLPDQGTADVNDLWRVLDIPVTGQEQIEISCGVIAVTAKNGLVITEKGIALETSRAHVVGGGTVSLATEAIDIALRPHSGMGARGRVVAGLLRLRGTLASPHLGIDETTLATAAATALAHDKLPAKLSALSTLLGGAEPATELSPCAAALGTGKGRER